MGRGGVGAYGFRLVGPLVSEEATPVLHPAPSHWTDLAVEWCEHSGSVEATEIGEEVAVVQQLRTAARISREPFAMTVLAPRPPTADEVAHPCLSAAAAVAARWDDREAFHGGAVELDGRAWGILAGRGGGKSTLLAALTDRGCRVIADDQIAVRDGMVLAGPRGVDLREGSAARFGHLPGRPVRAGERFRLAVPEGAPEVPLGGWIVLDEAEQVGVTEVRGAARLDVLGSHRMIRLPSAVPAELLRLASFPTVRLAYPRRWDRLAAVVEQVRGITTARAD